ncbi:MULTISPECIES: hypothetical protein [unclassified Streptomyces]|uniref:hypothetical protein n=1 Tax=unclassified Streptomyces TaxID=2593676 RepID=UPI000A58B2EE|nr:MULTISPECIES: hypothetical protein [unclassified Streptomyces]
MPRRLWWAGITALAGGAVLCVLGWYGVSGERFAERQLPYLASSTVPGAALVVAGSVWLAALWLAAAPPAGPRQPEEARPEPTAPVRPSSQGPPVRVPGGTLVHRPDCPLVAGKPDVVPAAGADLDPCPVCEPDGGEGPAGGPSGAADGGAGSAYEGGGGP